MDNTLSIILKKNRDFSVKRFHPWIFSGAIQQINGSPGSGDLVKVFSQNGEFLAKGHYQQGSIAVRIITFEDVPIDQNFWRKKIGAALTLRESTGLINNPFTDCFRLFHAEGDGIPGLIIDVYKNVAVLQPHNKGIYQVRQEISAAIEEVMSGSIDAIFHKNPSGNELGPEGFIFGNTNEQIIIRENNCRFSVNIKTGQKTGFFLDQRWNRELLSNYACDKNVLNTFCYTGGFSVYALKGGATFVTSIDSSDQAVKMVSENIELNFQGNSRHREITGNAVQFLGNLSQEFNLIVLDPPAFAKQLSARHNAIQAYKRINYEAIKSISKGGIIFTFSCSQVIDREMFRGAVLSAAIEAGRSVRILHHLSQPEDHPVNIFHPEGEYLKGLVLFVE